MVLLRVVLGVLVAAHGLVHLLYLVPAPDDPKWPFRLTESRLVPEAARRPVGIALVAVTIVAFALVGLAIAGVPGLSAVWPSLAVIGSASSLATLILFWNAQLLLGVAIDVGLIIVALVRPEWTDRIG